MSARPDDRPVALGPVEAGPLKATASAAPHRVHRPRLAPAALPARVSLTFAAGRAAGGGATPSSRRGRNTILRPPAGARSREGMPVAVPAELPRTLLVVEDNDAIREGLAAVLRSAGYRVHLAENGEEALRDLRAGPRPDLILLDMLMPVVDGWHFLERLGREGPQPPVPVVITTATVLSREWAESHGCAGFLRKPVEPEALLDEVRRCLAAAG